MDSIRKLLLLIFAAVSGLHVAVAQPAPGRVVPATEAETPRLLIRSDDMGFSHAANDANRALAASGLPVNISVLFCAPWWKEAVEILKDYPHVSVGVHLCANSEWKHYKWGPVSSHDAVPSIVDEEGYFFASYRALNIERAPDVDDLQREFRAQIERALDTGLRIDYLDNHMGAGLATEEQRAMVRGLSDEYGLAWSGEFREISPGTFHDGPEDGQLDRLISLIDGMHPDSLYRIVFHVARDWPETRAMLDANQDDDVGMAEQRQRELDMLLSDRFRAAVRNVRLVTYRDLNR